MDQTDLEDLWREANAAFRPIQGSGETKDTNITIVTRSGTRSSTIEDTDIKTILKTSLLRTPITEITLNVSQFWETGGDADGRSLTISISRQDRTSVKLNGQEDWIHETRSRIDSFLEQRTNKSATLRPIAAAALYLPAALTFGTPVYRYLIQVRGDDPPFAVIGAVLISLLFLVPIWWTITALYPVSTITLRARLESPWYIKLGREILITLIATLVGTAILTYYHYLLP